MSDERLWAPWRLAYVQSGKGEQEEPFSPVELLPGGDAECFLCQAAVVPDERQRHIVYRNEQALVVLNRYPYNNGHLLVAPRRHVGRLDGLAAEEMAQISTELIHMVGLLERTLRPDGFNIGLNLGRVAGAGLPGHVHWHIVPRWSGDTNFMPVLAGVHVIPQSLDALWELLTAELGT